jgi:hypothetical protein
MKVGQNVLFSSCKCTVVARCTHGWGTHTYPLDGFTLNYETRNILRNTKNH